MSTVNSLPPLPPVPNNGRGRITVDIPFQGPVLVDTRLGNIPHDYHSYSSHVDQPYTPCAGGACTISGREVWRPLPAFNPDGSAKLQPAIAHIDEAARSAGAYALVWGGAGAAVGGAIGALVGLIGGSPVGVAAGIGALVAGGIAGGLGFRHAHGDRIKLEWQEKPVNDLRLEGYRHDVHERTREECHYYHGRRVCHRVNDGWDHDFSPDVQATKVGTYWEPVVVHYKEH